MLHFEAASVPAHDERLHRDTDSFPNIYYIVLDMYTRGDVLADLYQHDNGPFLQALRDRGFYIAERSHSNYPCTILSIPSALNMNYFTELGKRIGIPLARPQTAGGSSAQQPGQPHAFALRL